MKNIKYLVFIFILLFVNIFYVHASCTGEEINLLKNEAKNIKITYKHLGLVEEFDGESHYNSFDVTIKNIDDDFYLSIFEGENGKLNSKDGIIKLTLDTGNWSLKVYSEKCDSLVEKINFRLPRFNIYSLDSLCEGIDGNDFKLCGKYYETYVPYGEFVSRVNNYRATHNVNKGESIDTKETMFDTFVNFVAENKLYFIITAILFLSGAFIIIVIRKRKKRGVLE